MDLSLSFEKYILLPSEEALTEYKDEKNLKSLRIFLVIVSSLFLVIAAVYAFQAGPFSVSAIFNFVLSLSALLLRKYFNKIFSIKNARRSSYIFLITFLITLMISHILIDVTAVKKETVNIKFGPEPKSSKTGIIKNTESDETDTQSDDKKSSDNFTDTLFFFGISVLFFRFSRNELIQLFSLGFGVTFATLFIFRGAIVSENIPNFIFASLLCVIALTSESKIRKKFLKQYNHFRSRHSDNIRIKQELNYAREMQLSMLPERNAKIEDIEISAISIPASEVGGDYFDYFKITDSKVGIFICDVSGHGVVSALLLSGLRSCMHLILEETSNPREVFYKLNRMIRKTQNRKMFVTAIFAVIDIKANTCSLFNAGHQPPYKISGDSNELYKIRKHGLALGAADILEKIEGESEVEFEFKKNDKLLFYTDGLTEAMNPSRQEFGFEKLENFLNENADKSSDILLGNLQNFVEGYTQNTTQIDDLTIIVIGRD